MWLTAGPASGSIAPGDSAEVTLTFDAADLPEGTYTADVVLTTSDPQRPFIMVPVTLTVVQDEPDPPGPGVGTVVATLTGPSTFPKSGGKLRFDLTFSNTSEGDFVGEYAVLVTLPNGSPYGPIFGPTAISLASGASQTQSFSANVPKGAPQGSYIVTASIGADYPDDIDSQSSFGFTKTNTTALVAGSTEAGAEASGVDALTWVMENLTLGTTSTLVMSADEAELEVSSLAVSPNPARGEAKITFALAEAGEATVVVYDVQGREVVRLAEGRLDAGTHVANWASGAVAPGVYIVRLQAGADLLTQRIVVIR